MNKLTTTILAGALLAGAAATASAQRNVGQGTNFRITAASTTTDLARTRDENGVQKLRYTDEEFTNEQASVKFFPDGRRALYVHMRTGPINEGTAMESSPVNQMQCALSRLDLTVDAVGDFKVARPTTGPAMYDIWATDNDGNEYRNCNKPELFALNDSVMILRLNYQPDNGDDTITYFRAFTDLLEPVPINGQTQQMVFAKNNDDCAMHQSGAAGPQILRTTTPNKIRTLNWFGCNGNGEDDGYLGVNTLTWTGTGAATQITFTRDFDVTLANREERSRGRCTVSAAKPNLAMCAWTEGNNQPQREGVWIAGIDISEDGEQGEEAQSRLLWKDRIEHRVDVLVNGEPREAYAMRMNSTRLVSKNPTSGELENAGQVLLYWGLSRGGNNNDKKGGRFVGNRVMVVEPTETSYITVMEKTDINPLLLGFEGTHVSVTEAIFGKGDELKPGFTFMVGSHNGGLASNAEMRTLMYDPTSKAIVNLGQHDLAGSYDRHLYSNYLGNNPGNQGRNFAHCDMVKNPYADMAGNFVSYFQACAMTGKLPEHTSSAIKPSATLTIFPVAFTKEAPPLGGSWDDEEVPGEDNPDPDNDPGPGTSVGGCSTSNGSSTLLFALALGLATFIRRRK